MDNAEWEQMRAKRLSEERPDWWPDGVRAITVEGLTLFGMHEKTEALYWDGKEVIIRRSFRLGTFERWVASIAAAGTFGTFVVSLVRYFTGH